MAYLNIVADHIHPFVNTVYPFFDDYLQQELRLSQSGFLNMIITGLYSNGLQCHCDPIESLWDMVEQEIHIMDLQSTNLKQLCDAIMSVSTKILQIITSFCWIYGTKYKGSSVIKYYLQEVYQFSKCTSIVDVVFLSSENMHRLYRGYRQMQWHGLNLHLTFLALKCIPCLIFSFFVLSASTILSLDKSFKRQLKKIPLPCGQLIVNSWKSCNSTQQVVWRAEQELEER